MVNKWIALPRDVTGTVGLTLQFHWLHMHMHGIVINPIGKCEQQYYEHCYATVKTFLSALGQFS